MTPWVETQGTMLSGTLASSQSYNQSSSSYQTYYEPVVTYRYEVNGVPYTGTRITEWSLSYGSSNDAQKFLAEHPVGSTVRVYSDPVNPAGAILEKGLGSTGQKQMALAGGVMAGILAAFGGLTVVIVALMLILLCGVAAVVLWALGMGFQFPGS